MRSAINLLILTIFTMLLAACGGRSGIEYKPEYVPSKCDYGWELEDHPTLGSVCVRSKKHKDFLSKFDTNICYFTGLSMEEKRNCQKYAKYEGLSPFVFEDDYIFQNNSKPNSTTALSSSNSTDNNSSTNLGLFNQVGENSWDTKLFRLGEMLQYMGTPYSQRGVAPAYRWMADEPNSGFTYDDYNQMSEQNKLDRKIKELEKKIKDSTFGYTNGTQVYSKSNKYMGYIENGGLYNQYNQKIGYIRGNSIYSNSGEYLGYTR